MILFSYIFYIVYYIKLFNSCMSAYYVRQIYMYIYNLKYTFLNFLYSCKTSKSLYIVCRIPNKICITNLLKKGANPNYKNPDYNFTTPVDVAIMFNNKESLFLLYNYGGKIKFESFLNMTVIYDKLFLSYIYNKFSIPKLYIHAKFYNSIEFIQAINLINRIPTIYFFNYHDKNNIWNSYDKYKSDMYNNYYNDIDVALFTTGLLLDIYSTKFSKKKYVSIFENKYYLPNDIIKYILTY